MKHIIWVLFLLFMSSCAYHFGGMTGNAQLSDNNFELIEVGSGTSSAFRVFGIGGFSKTALVLEAKKNLYRNYPLNKGQAYANVTVDFQQLHLLLYNRTQVTVTADIVQFYGEGDPSIERQALFENIEQQQSLGFLNVDDTVYLFIKA